jgi:uncharacterized protein YodC (DUF2158 family)
MEHDFKPGDKVRLNSGSPVMTIEDIGKYGMGATKDNAKCVWFDGKKRCEEIFELVTLQHVTDDDDPNIPAVGIARLHRG